jgi:ABC-type antimicrobial peptide transport system permease subunit
LPGLDGPWMSIVGVVSDAIYNRDGVVVPVFYMSIRQWVMQEFSLVVRTSGDPLSMAASVRTAVRSLDPTVPYFDISTVENRLEELDHPRRFQTQLIGAFAGIALILAALGLYGLMSYSVEQRTKEFGIRVALGATAGNLVGLVLGQGLRWALGGIAFGIIGALAFGRALSASLFGVTATDPLTLATVVALLACVAAGACGVPTRRAAKVDRTVALRHE